MMDEARFPAIFVDGDGCPVKDEVLRVARRYDMEVFLVSNHPIHMRQWKRLTQITVGQGFDAADSWIVEHLLKDDIVITADLPLAELCLKRGAHVVGPRGRVHTIETIGSALATRELMEGLRQMGEITGGPPPMVKASRSMFLQKLDEVVQRVRRLRGM